MKRVKSSEFAGYCERGSTVEEVLTSAEAERQQG